MSEIVQPDKLRGIVTLDSVVRSALMDLGLGLERYEVFKHWAIEGFRDWHFGLSQEIKTAKLELTAWKSIEIPVDYVDWVKIGVLNSDGRIMLFTHDDRIGIHHEDTDGYPEDVTSTETLPEPTVDANVDELPLWNYGDSGQLFGLVAKSNSVGYYKFNPQRREIQFAPSIKSDTVVYLEYISDGIDPCAKTVVNVYAAKLLKLYIHWQRVKFARSSSMAEKEMARRDYYVEHGVVQSRLSPVTVEDVLEASRNGYRLTPYI